MDRWRLRSTLVVAHIGAGAGLLLIPILAWTGHLNLLFLAVILFAVGVFSVFDAAAEQSIVPELVPTRMFLVANARVGQAATVSQTSAPALGGALISILSAPVTVLISACTHFLAAGFMTTVRTQETRAASDTKPRILREISSGLKFVYTHRSLAPLGLSTHLWFVVNSVAVTVFALFALRELALDPLVYGVVLACAGVGGLIGAFCAPTAARKLGEGNTIIVGKLITPVAWIGVALIPHGEPWAIVCLIAAKTLYGFGLGVEDPSELAYRQAKTSRGMLGRVNATMRSANRTMAVVGSLLGGLLAASFGYRATLWLAIGLFIVAVGIALFSPVRGSRLSGHSEGR